jgi:hypothetical protein
VAKAKIEYPTFGVFAEAVPDAARLADPSTPARERLRIEERANWAVGAARDAADRNTQLRRHAENHERRAKVMQGLRRDANGKPLRGEPKRLAGANPGVTVRQIQKWIEQLRQPALSGGEVLPDDWSTVYYGEAVLQQTREAGRKGGQQRHKKSSG